MLVAGSIVPGNVMLELALNVAKQAGSTKAIAVRSQPRITQFLLDQAEVTQCQLGVTDTTGRFETPPVDRFVRNIPGSYGP